MHSIVLALLNSSSNWYINIDRGDTNTVIFLDIKKAFDTTDHSGCGHTCIFPRCMLPITVVFKNSFLTHKYTTTQRSKTPRSD